MLINLITVITSVIAFTIFVAGLMSYLRNPYLKPNKWFFIFTSSLAIWLMANFIDSNFVNINLTVIMAKIDFSFALILAWSFLKFVNALIHNSGETFKDKHYIVDNKIFNVANLSLIAFLIVGIFTNSIVKISISTGSLVVNSGALYNVYQLYLIIIFLYPLIMIVTNYKKIPRRDRQAINLLSLGYVIALLTNLATNLLFPAIINSRPVVQSLNIFGYLGLLIFVTLVYFAISTKHLFDIRLAIARSLTYIFLISIIGFIFSGLTIFLSQIITGTHLSASVIITITILAFILAITFQYAKNLFTQFTDKLFFKDKYNPQKVLNVLNNNITSTLIIDDLIHQTIELFKDTFKCQYILFVVDQGEKKNRVFPENQLNIKINELTQDLKPLLKHHKIILREQLPIAISEHLSKINAELIIPLYNNKVYIGYIIYSLKQDGSTYNNDDKQLITIATDSLAVAMQNALRFEQIESFNLTLQDKVDSATYRLRKANDRLRILDETKDDFISMASHQLRTPLTSIKGYISMLLEGDAGKISKIQHDMLGQAFLSSQKMVFLIADMLNVSRLKTGKFAIEGTSVNLADIVEEEMNQLKETADVHEVKLNYDKPKNFPILNLDETKIRQVIMNFSDNAIYYTPKGGEISVKLQEKGNNIELRVKDNGIGVPAHERHHLFTKFYRAGNARKIRPDGTGLGLFMCKKVIIAHGGSLIFDSTEGKGSTFGFIFNKEKLAIKSSAKKPPKKVKEAEPVTV